MSSIFKTTLRLFAMLAPFVGAMAGRAGEWNPKTLAYVLQADAMASRDVAVAKLVACGRDLIVLDREFTTKEPWTGDDIAKIRAGKPSRRVLAYISIGEAENYRGYWQKTWRPGAPAWLDGENPEWKGNFRVKYWRDEWQKIALAEIEGAMAQGFDGVYLDIVDAFEGFEHGKDNAINPETRKTYRADMIAWVRRIAAGARAKKPDAVVVPQNGAQLLADATYLETVDAIGLEDVFTNGNRKQPRDETKYILENLQPIREAEKPVFVIEYPTQPAARTVAVNAAREQKLSILITDRHLKTLGESIAP